MAFDIDMRMFLYLAIITAGVYLFPIDWQSPYYYQIIGFGLIGVGAALAYRKSKKSN
jgi:hypothetical protein